VARFYGSPCRYYTCFSELLGGNSASSCCSRDSGAGIDCSQASLSSQLPHSQDWCTVDSQNSGVSQDVYQPSQSYQVQLASWSHAVGVFAFRFEFDFELGFLNDSRQHAAKIPRFCGPCSLLETRNEAVRWTNCRYN